MIAQKRGRLKDDKKMRLVGQVWLGSDLVFPSTQSICKLASNGRDTDGSIRVVVVYAFGKLYFLTFGLKCPHVLLVTPQLT